MAMRALDPGLLDFLVRDIKVRNLTPRKMEPFLTSKNTLSEVSMYLIITSRMRLGRAIFVSFFALSASYHPGEYI